MFKDRNIHGNKAGRIKVSITMNIITKFLKINFLFISIFKLYAKSEHPWACLSACQNLALTFERYPLPVSIFSWLKQTKIGFVLIFPYVFQ